MAEVGGEPAADPIDGEAGRESTERTDYALNGEAIMRRMEGWRE
jgi:hypothetical protein